jgi:hypothetical protein
MVLVHGIVRGAVVGTILADAIANRQAMKEWFMENENQVPQVRVSNWTLATGTRPGERDVWSSDRSDDADADVTPPVSGDARCASSHVGSRADVVLAA